MNWIGWIALGWLAGPTPEVAEGRALRYLEAEVPRWSREHRCFSCHNNGDAARALYRAATLGRSVAPEALRATSDWLARPEGWDANGPGGPSSDRRLARLAFSMALAEATRSGLPGGRDALRVAAARLAADQADDGSWPVEDGGLVGSPATYGRSLATATGVLALRAADPTAAARAIRRGEVWLRSRRPGDVVEAAAVLLIEPPGDPTEAGRTARAFLLGTQGRGGGWGPFRDAPAEPFDTGLALIALAPSHNRSGVAEALTRGRRALASMQEPDGSWPETTRPAGGESYAQRLSTAGWATLGLIASRPVGAGRD